MPGDAISSRRWAIMLKILFAVAAWGASFIATKIALREMEPVSIVWTRFGIGVLILWLAVRLRGRVALPGARDLAYFALLGGLGITFHQWLQSTGLITAQATTTAWIIASTPVFMALLGRIFFGERLGARGVAGIGLAGLGVLMVVSAGDWRALALGQFGAPGDLLILISAPNWAVFSALSRDGLRRYPAARMMLFVMGFGWLFSSLFFFTGGGLNDLAQLSADGWGALLFLGVACSGLAYIFWYDALQALPSAQVGTFLYLEPLVTVAVAGVMLDEPITAAALLGGAVILLGVWLVNRQSPDEARRN
ncbi:MAG: DMT family transporter [Chloroflexota bacterium]|jgi:drug/metabolite transporter (DMT)-like permease